ncbi:MAG: FecR domain-containing protein [Pseudomonadota bacterium]
MLKIIFTTVLLWSAAAVSAQGPAQTIGQVLNASGQVSSGTMALRTGQPVLTAAHLISGNSSFAKLRMQDDSLIALGESSDFQIEQYLFRYQAAAVETSRARYVLNSGSVRMVSGAMSRLNPGSVVLATPYGDITTLGTDYSVGVCAAGCPSQPGLYVSVKSGRVRISGSRGVIVVGSGEVLRLSATGVESLLATPGFMLALDFDGFPSLDTTERIRVRLGVDTQDFLNGVIDPAASPSLPLANNSR